MQVDSFLLAIVVGVLSSLLASILFLLTINRMKPVIQISDQIVRLPDHIAARRDFYRDGPIYQIKTLNNTWRSSVVMVKAELELFRQEAVPGGVSIASKKIPLRRDEAMEIPGRKRNDKNAEYATIWFIDAAHVPHGSHDLCECWREASDKATTSLRFTIYAIHPVSGFGSTATKEYPHMDTCVIEGQYEHGSSVRIVNPPVARGVS